jgi:signal peptidase I
MRKRVVAAQGDLVKTCDNLVTVNEEVFYRWKDTIDCQDFETISLKLNEFFVLGDNLKNSLDSRTFGVISRDDIFAESLYKVTADTDEIRLK